MINSNNIKLLINNIRLMGLLSIIALMNIGCTDKYSLKDCNRFKETEELAKEIECRQYFAEQGMVRQQMKTAYLNYEAKNYPNALYWYQLATDNGDDLAPALLGSMYMEGEGVEKNHEKAVEYNLIAANRGSGRGQVFLGNFYLKEEFDIDKSIYWFTKAAEQGSVDSGIILIGIYLNIKKLEVKNNTPPLYFLEKSSILFPLLKTEKTYLSTLNEVADYLEKANANPQDFTKALYWAKRSVKIYNDTYSLFLVASMYLNGLGVEASAIEAIRYIEESVANYIYDTDAIIPTFFLGIIYFCADDLPLDGVKTDYQKSFYWYKKSEKINGSSQERLYYMYSHGLGVEKNLKKAEYWKKKYEKRGSCNSLEESTEQANKNIRNLIKP